jgi:hypothetical protein
MSVFLQIVGGLFLLVVVLIGLGFLYLRWQFKKLGAAMANSLPQPLTLDLRPIDDDAFEDSAVKTFVTDFQQLGYVRGSAYRPREMEMLVVMSFINAPLDAFGVVYNLNDGSKVWADIVQRYENGSATISNASPSGLNQRPGYENTYLAGKSIAELHQHFIAMQKPSAMPVSEQAFKAEFEEAYASEMVWRDSTGISAEEIEAVARNGNLDTTDEVLALTQVAVAQQVNERLQQRLRAEFLRTTTMSAADWDKVEDYIAIVHDKLTDEELDYVRERALPETEVKLNPMPPGSPRIAFAAFNTTLPDDRQFKLLGTVSNPIEADIYAAPAEEYAR